MVERLAPKNTALYKDNTLENICLVDNILNNVDFNAHIKDINNNIGIQYISKKKVNDECALF